LLIVSKLFEVSNITEAEICIPKELPPSSCCKSVTRVVIYFIFDKIKALLGIRGAGRKGVTNGARAS